MYMNIFPEKRQSTVYSLPCHFGRFMITLFFINFPNAAKIFFTKGKTLRRLLILLIISRDILR